MTVQVTTEPGADRVLALKRATGAADVARLRHEASVLAQARHPDVIELVSFGEEGDVAELRTGFAGSHTLATVGPLAVAHAAGAVAAVAAVVADLHEIGIVHGRIDTSHVLIGRAGRPVLCGFAGGGRPGSRPPADPAPAADPDPACPPGTPLLPAVDVYGLGALLRTLVGAAVDDVEPIPDRRFPRRLPRLWSGVPRRALLNLADQATADDHRVRPNARAFAAAIHRTVPGAQVATPEAPAVDRPPDGEEREPRRVLPIATVIGGLLLLVAGIRALGSGGGTLVPAAATATTAAPATTGASAPPPSTTTTAPVPTTATGCALAPGPSAADVDGDGCPDPIAIDGEVVTVGGVRYSFGGTGDQIAVADWDCDGHATPALLRPATGEVFVFPGWALTGRDLTVPATQRVKGGRSLVADPAGAACPHLVVQRADGTDVQVS